MLLVWHGTYRRHTWQRPEDTEEDDPEESNINRDVAVIHTALKSRAYYRVKSIKESTIKGE